jgi:hypothetical protein
VCVTGLTGVCHLWDLPRVNCLTRVSLNRGASGMFLVYVELFYWALCRVLSAPIHSPSLVPRIGPSIGIKAGYGSCLTLTTLRSMDGVPGMGFWSSTLRWQKLPDVE